MGEIKSALELAMERSSKSKIDKEALKQREFLTVGKKIAAQLLLGKNSAELMEQWQALSKSARSFAKQGIVETLRYTLHLPKNQADLDSLEKLHFCLVALGVKEASLSPFFTQVRSFCSEYLQAKENIEQGLQQQYEAPLRSREAALRQQTGRKVSLPFEADPKYLEALQAARQELDKTYSGRVAQARDLLSQLL